MRQGTQVVHPWFATQRTPYSDLLDANTARNKAVYGPKNKAPRRPAFRQTDPPKEFVMGTQTFHWVEDRHGRLRILCGRNLFA